MSRTFEFEKLVRDNIANLDREQGHAVVERKLSHEEHIFALLDKFDEELQELRQAIETGEDVAGELADIITIANSLAKLIGVSEEELLAKIAQKNERNGAFDDGIYIERLTLNEGDKDTDKWLEYFLKNPDKYPEVL